MTTAWEFAIVVVTELDWIGLDCALAAELKFFSPWLLLARVTGFGMEATRCALPTIGWYDSVGLGRYQKSRGYTLSLNVLKNDGVSRIAPETAIFW